MYSTYNERKPVVAERFTIMTAVSKHVYIDE